LCRICDRFSPNPDPSRRPVLYLKREAIKHEKTLDHQHCVDQYHEFLKDYPDLLEREKQCEMGWGLGHGDPSFPDEVYDYLTRRTPDVRKGVDFVNQFVTFWSHDVAAALEEPEDEGLTGWPAKKSRGKERGKEKQESEEEVKKRHTRPTFEEFFEGIEIESDSWEVQNDNDGWGAAVPTPVPRAESVEEKSEEKDIPDEDGWIVQKGRGGRGRGRGGGRGRGRAKQRGRGGRQRQPRRATNKPEDGQASRKVQDVGQNLFTQVDPSSLWLGCSLTAFLIDSASD
jgi:hypothetical protein